MTTGHEAAAERALREAQAASYSLRELLNQPTLADTVDALAAALSDAQGALRTLDAGMQQALDPDDYVSAWLCAFPEGQPAHVRAALAPADTETP